MSKAKALEGIRVVELTIWLQGPVAGQYLADLGAEVIKVERPGGGDQGRGVASLKSVPVGDFNWYFMTANRNKKSIVIDLSKPEGQEILYHLIEKADVFLSNLTQDRLASWNLSYEKLSAINPRLIYAMTTGYGPMGGISKPAFDITVQTLTGTATRIGEPGQPPTYTGNGTGDTCGATMGALGIMLALFHRNRTGKGQFIDGSLYSAQLFLGAPYLQSYLAGHHEVAMQRSRRDAPNSLWNLYPTRGKWVYVCAENEDANFAAMSRALAAPELLQDARFATTPLRNANNQALIAAIDALTTQRSHEELAAALARENLPASPVNNMADLIGDEQAWANQYIMKAYSDEVQREVQIRGLPLTLSKTPAEVQALGPQLGQDTETLMLDLLGYEWEAIEELKAKEVIL